MIRPGSPPPKKKKIGKKLNNSETQVKKSTFGHFCERKKSKEAEKMVCFSLTLRSQKLMKT